jgi:hypothetical protein
MMHENDVSCDWSGVGVGIGTGIGVFFVDSDTDSDTDDFMFDQRIAIPS